MSIKSISLEDSTPEQRRAFVTDFLNLEISPSASDDDVSNAIAKAQPGSQMIFIQEVPTEAEATEPMIPQQQFSPDEQARIDKLNLRPEERGRPQAGSLGRNDPRYLIMIPSFASDDESGALDVMVGVNGVAWQLRRNQELDVPARVVEALRNAVTDDVRHIAEKGNEAVVDTVVTKSPRVNFQILRAPSQAELDAWQKETAGLFCA